MADTCATYVGAIVPLHNQPAQKANEHVSTLTANTTAHSSQAGAAAVVLYAGRLHQTAALAMGAHSYFTNPLNEGEFEIFCTLKTPKRHRTRRISRPLRPSGRRPARLMKSVLLSMVLSKDKCNACGVRCAVCVVCSVPVDPKRTNGVLVLVRKACFVIQLTAVDSTDCEGLPQGSERERKGDVTTQSPARRKETPTAGKRLWLVSLATIERVPPTVAAPRGETADSPANFAVDVQRVCRFSATTRGSRRVPPSLIPPSSISHAFLLSSCR